MSLERKRGVDEPPSLASLPELPKLKGDEKGRVQADDANEALSEWWVQAFTILTQEVDGLRRRISELERAKK